MRVLLVEDDVTLQRGLAHVLTDAGHRAIVVGNGVYADTLLATEPFDLVVLDLGLPQMDGIMVLENLRKRRQTLPVLILSARDRTQDRVRGLDSGADDYMTKPFELSEFEARVRALLRRGQGASLRIGLLEWFWDRREAAIDARTISLSRHEVSVLEALVQNPGRIIAKDTLAHQLGVDGEVAGSNLVEVYIHRLRRKLAEARVEIRTVRGLGYRLQEIRED
ncbi:MAG: response regulator transcription factor [Sterolibacterium sp.]|nr:response regulator transcription factor [Sterolibacterium sp.]